METTDLKTKVTGKMELQLSHHEKYDIGDVDGHIISLRKAEGKNVNTGTVDFMNGAKIINFSYNDVVKGNGPHQGYSILTKNGDSLFSKWEGEIITTLSADGTPVTSFKGRMWWYKTTGKFEKMKEGGGTYKGRFTSETSYVIDWEGEYF